MKQKKIYKFKVIREKEVKYEVIDDVINNPEIIAQIAINDFYLLQETQEVCLVFALNNQNKIVGILELNRGTINASIIDRQQLFRFLLLAGCNKFIIIHNHPSGYREFSPEDENIYKKISSAGKLLDIECLDFMIVAENGNNKWYNSIKQLGGARIL